MSTGSIPTSTWSSGMNGMMNVNGTNGMYSLTVEQPPNSNNSNIVVKVETVEESFTDTMPPRTHTTPTMDELESKKDRASITILSPEQPVAVVSASSPGLPNSPPRSSPSSLPSSSSLPTPSSSLSMPTSTPMPASPPSSSSSSYASASTSTSPARALPALTHTSTFRRVRPSHTSSPLARPNSVILSTQSQSGRTTSSPLARPTSMFIPNATDATSAPSVPTSPITSHSNPISPAPSSILSSSPLNSSVSGAVSPSRTLTPPPPAPTVIVTSPSQESRITSITSPTPVSTSPSPLPPTSKSPSKSPSKAPYRPGFQPTGLTRFRTDEFLIARKLARDGPGGPGEGIGTNEKRVERTKLERRLEKIIALHFPETVDSGIVRVKKEEKGNRGGQEKEREKDSKDLKSVSGNRMPARPVRPSLLGNANPSSTDSRKRTSSFFENFDIRDIRRMSGSFIGGIGGSEVESIRSSEQRITPWQPDSAVSRCPHCDTSFHPLSNRKHHCRLCGRVVCALGVTSGKRVEPCSILFVVDPKTRQIEQVEEGVDYGVRKRKPSVDIRSTSSKDGGKPGLVEAGLAKRSEEEQLEEEEKFLKGVRICRECKPVLLREQYLRERNITVGGVTGEFLRLYEAFLGLEKEIEDSLPAFEELLVGLKMSGNNNGSDLPHALTAQTATAAAERKRLLQVFARYDALAKRIRSLPCGIQGKGSKGNQNDKGIKAKGTKGEYNINTSQERVQAAIALRAARFLEARMVGLGAVPSSVSAAQGKREKSNSKDSNMGTSPSIGIHPSSSSAIISSPSSFSPSSSASQNLDATLQKTLQPLLEQESLLESYIAEATKARKFEDAKILRGNLREIRGEIGRVVGDV
ncbi:FYVE zinc finger-domain-containing protein [Lentinula lateritia]|uniref:FYVE zinc finger-domain-containing protein n=1 Tax=Lentinula lateritia TaxID=40482 RepID=A0ABQ8V8B8_9AGAR|nr:FYVE zinc finger-domain-containing protein [Lentinula lateritia]